MIVLHDAKNNKKTVRAPRVKISIISKGVIMTNAISQQQEDKDAVYVASFEHLRMTDVESVGGKNASLGEMISQLAEAGVRVPGGFATTAQAFRDFLSYSANGGLLLAERIAQRLEGLNIDDVRSLAPRSGYGSWKPHSSHAWLLKSTSSTPNWWPIPTRKCSLPCVPPPRRKICRMRLLLVSKKPS